MAVFGSPAALTLAVAGTCGINKHLKAVFRVAELAEEAQKLLCCATLLPEGGMDDELFLTPFAEEDGDWLDDLIEGGWLYMKDGLLCIHPVIRIVCVEELKPSDEVCENFVCAPTTTVRGAQECIIQICIQIEKLFFIKCSIKR